jgi:surfeit locus 1 family protein
MRLPVFPTILVAAAVATMIALGIWQIHRAGEKHALIARYDQNAKLPPIALAGTGAVNDTLLFRRGTAMCLSVTRWRATGGRSASGTGGTRFIADCRTGAEGPGFAADMGVSANPRIKPTWTGGMVTGVIVGEPSTAGLMDRILRRSPPARPMLVSDRPAPGLEASAAPTRDSVPDNHIVYAIQWFFFAAAAAIIYLLALRRRRRA